MTGQGGNAGGAIIGLRLGLREIGSNARRSVLSLLSICLGIATVLILNSLTGGAKQQSLQQMNRMGGISMLTVESVQPATPEEEAAFSRSEGLRYEEMQNFVRQADCCDTLFPEGWHKDNSLRGPKGPKSGHAMAVNWLHFEQRNVSVGDLQETPTRLASAWDHGEEICVLGDKLAADLFGESRAALGQTVEYGKVKWRVVGLVISASRLDWRRGLAYYPYPAYLHHFAGKQDKLQTIKVRMRGQVEPETAVRELRAYLLKNHRGVRDFSIQTAEEQIAENAKASETLSLLGWAIALMALGVGGVGILNLMLATVSGRLREIGVRKALGANDASILAQFLAESITVSGMGTVLGLVLGGAPTWFLGDVLPVTPTLTLGDYGLALVLGWSTGLFAGIYPALKAARLSPVEALRG
ncbi:MAG: ABC transporter permease [Fibrobacteria bacterium]